MTMALARLTPQGEVARFFHQRCPPLAKVPVRGPSLLLRGLVLLLDH